MTAALTQREGEWLPISSAPKDGTPILVPGRYGVTTIACWWPAAHVKDGQLYGDWDDGEREGEDEGFIPFNPQYWQPLPAPPGNVSTLPRQGVDVPEELRAEDLACEIVARLHGFDAATQFPEVLEQEYQIEREIVADGLRKIAASARVPSPSDAAPDAVGEALEALLARKAMFDRSDRNQADAYNLLVKGCHDIWADLARASSRDGGQDNG